MKRSCIPAWLVVLGICAMFILCNKGENEPPEVKIVTPDSGAYVKKLVNVEIQVKDDDLDELELYIDDSLVHSFEIFSTMSYRYNWDVESLPDMSLHSLYSYARDDMDNEVFSDTIVVTVHPAGEIKWQLQLDGRVVSAPALARDGTIIVGTTNQTLYAIDTSGSTIWTYALSDNIGSAPTIASNGDIIVGTASGLLAVNANGQYQWEYPGIDFGESSPAIASDGTIYVGAADSMLYALYPNGSLKWQFYTWNPVSSSPVIGADGTIFIGTDGNAFETFYAVHPDGTERWKYQTNSSVHSTPAIGSDGTVYFYTDNKTIYAFLSDGNRAWSYLQLNNWQYSITISEDNMLYTGDFSSTGNDCLYQISQRAIIQWAFITSTSVSSSSAVSSDGAIYYPTDRGLIALIQQTGTVRWQCSDVDSCCTAPTIGSDGTIYIGNKQGVLFAVIGSAPVAGSSWPMLQHDAQHTGRVP